MSGSPSAPTDVRVREATPEDALAIADVHAAAIRELGSDAYDDRQVRAWLANVHPERYPIGEAGFRVLVAETDGNEDNDDEKIVGFGLLDCEPSEHGDATGELVAVYVRPDRVRMGIGSAVLARLEDVACDAGLEQLVLTASRNAIEFYRQEGYEGCETVELEMEDGVSLACLRMRKRLEQK